MTNVAAEGLNPQSGRLSWLRGRGHYSIQRFMGRHRKVAPSFVAERYATPPGSLSGCFVRELFTVYKDSGAVR